MRKRRALGDRYLLRAQTGDPADPTERTVNVGIATVAGIAFADAICLDAIGEYAASGKHADAMELLRSVDHDAAKHLQTLIGMKTATHYGVNDISVDAARRAMRAVEALAARTRLL